MASAKDLRPLFSFVVSILVFIFYRRPHDEISLEAIAIKIAPILFLASFVWTRGVCVPSRYNYSKYIFLAMIFSAIGDAFVQLSDAGYFVHGMAAFAMGHIFFVCAFGMNPRNYLLAVPLILYGIVYNGFLFQSPNILKDPPFAVALPIYSAIISTMVWRALARWRFEAKAATKKKNESRAKWTLVGFLGAVSFLTSDSSLAWWVVVGEFPNVGEIVITTYYAAQLLFSLSILHEKDDSTSEDKDEKSIKSPSTNNSHAQSKVNGYNLASTTAADKGRLHNKVK